VIHGPFDSQNVLARSSDMGGEVRERAVLLDAMGTLLRLEDPAPRLRAALAARAGVDVGAAAAAAAIRAEIAYYRAHLHLGRDAESLAALRGRCA
jgi:putative hydrolase of the HAD superfamily